MARFLLLGNRSIQHSLAVRLKSEGNTVDVFPGQNFGGYKITTDPVANEYDCLVVGSTRYFDHAVVKEALRNSSCAVFGVDDAAGRLETSKYFFSDFARKNGIPSPASVAFTNFKDALDFVRSHEPPYVIKAAGPARGCGVEITDSISEAEKDLRRKLVDTESPYFSREVTIERFVEGFEVAVNIFLDGNNYVILPPTKPHKRRNDNDAGPNVAGMGSFSPLQLNASFYSELSKSVVTPTMKAIRSAGWYFRGCLFVNLMLNDDGISVLEFNCRMGDPATLVDIELLESPLTDLLLHTANGTLAKVIPVFKNGFAVATTIVESEYPNQSQEAGPFILPAEGSSGKLFIAGLHLTNAGLFSNNGVIGSAVAYGNSTKNAKSQSLALARRFIHLNPAIPLDCRNDISNAIVPPQRFAPLL